MSAILTSDSEQSLVMESVQSTKKKKRETLPTCSLCRNHNLKILSSGHKGRCPGMYCICKKCKEKKQSRNQSKESTKKERQEKKEQERQARIKLTGSELIRVEPEKDIIPFDIPKEDKKKLPKAIVEDENIMNIIKFNLEGRLEKRREVTIFTGQTGRKRKVEIDEVDSSEKRLKLDFPLETTPINKLENLLRYGLYNCLRYDIRDITTVLAPLVDEIITIILECTSSSEGTENSLDEAKNRIYLVSQNIHRLIESHYNKCLQERSVQCMYGIETLQNSFWPWLLNHTTLTNVLPCTDILPKPTIYPYYQPNTGV